MWECRSVEEMRGEGLVELNVGGERFTTSKATLCSVNDSFFTALLSGRLSALKDASGAIFIDRDPRLFRIILNYLRTKHLDLNGENITTLRHEAQYYGLGPLVKRLMLCEELEETPCGDVLFHGFLPPPPLPLADEAASSTATSSPTSPAASSQTTASRTASEPPAFLPRLDPLKFASVDLDPAEKVNKAHSRASSADYLSLRSGPTSNGWAPASTPHTHRRGASSDLTRILKEELNTLLKAKQQRVADPLRVRLIRGHHNWVAVGYSHFVACYRLKDSLGWQLGYVTPRCELEVRHIALNAKFGAQSSDKMLAAAMEDGRIHLWHLLGADSHGDALKVGVFNLGTSMDSLFWIGSQLVGLSRKGKVGIWHGMTTNWQVQDVFPISAYDTAGSALLLGCTNGCIYYIDMQKFPLRMKDGDLLVTELYRDPSAEAVTSLSVYLTPKTNLCGNWIEIAYGTQAGAVRVIVQHPETVGHGPQLFQTFTVHRAPITKVALTTHHLIALCSEYNHVRSWVLTRFRGMISTQPGSTPLASFKALTLESADTKLDYDAPDVGPFGDQDGEQVLIQKIVPDTDQLFVRLASNGDRVCVIKSVDGSSVSAYLVHECEGSSRMGSSRPRRYLFSGHSNGTIQMWDLTTALDAYYSRRDRGASASLPTTSSASSLPTASGAAPSTTPLPRQPLSLPPNPPGGPTPSELLALIDDSEITCSSLSTTPAMTPAPSISHLPSYHP